LAVYQPATLKRISAAAKHLKCRQKQIRA
jgi:hypothetical protein